MALNGTVDPGALPPSDDAASLRSADPDPADGEERGSSTDGDSDGAGLLGDANPTLKANKLSLFNGLSIVIGLQVGSGIFAAPSQVARNVPSGAVGLVVWVVAGLLVWTGAASLIELGLQVPINGGLQEFLRECYGDLPASAFTWTWVGISRPASMAAITGIFADYFCRAAFPTTNVSWLVTRAVGLVGLWTITCVNCTGARAGAKVAGAFLVLKLFTLFSIIAIGFGAAILGTADHGSSDPSSRSKHGLSPTDINPPVQFKNLVDAIFAALFCYGGWESIGFVLGDMAKPTRDLPRLLTAAMIIVTTGFAMFNISLYIVLPLDTLRETTMPVMVFSEAVLGPPAPVVFSLMIAASCLGALNANVYATATLCVAPSKRGYLPNILKTNMFALSRARGLNRQDPSFGGADSSNINVPTTAMVANSALASVFLCVGTFAQLVSFKGIVEYFFLSFAILGIFVLRRRHRSDTNFIFRTKTWNPIIFIICSAVVVVRGVFSNFGQGIALVLTISLSCIIYWAQKSNIN